MSYSIFHYKSSCINLFHQYFTYFFQAIVSDGSEGQLCAYSVATGDIIGFVSDISALSKTGTYEIVGPAGGAVRGIGALFVIVRILPPPTPPPQPQPPPQV